jgi:hypothetical protein
LHVFCLDLLCLDLAIYQETLVYGQERHHHGPPLREIAKYRLSSTWAEAHGRR